MPTIQIILFLFKLHSCSFTPQALFLTLSSYMTLVSLLTHSNFSFLVYKTNINVDNSRIFLGKNMMTVKHHFLVETKS